MSDLQKLINETFNAHQPIIGRWARQNNDNFADVFRFVIATIQQPISTTPYIVEDYKKHGSRSQYAWGWKGVSLDWIEEKSGSAFDTMMFCWDHGGMPAVLSHFASMPGIGLVKGGFMAQLIFGEIGCLDRHNVERFGLYESAFAAYRFKRAKTIATRRAIINHYLDLCDQCGGSAQLWAEWCDYVAQRDSSLETAVEVSRIHLTALGLEE